MARSCPAGDVVVGYGCEVDGLLADGGAAQDLYHCAARDRTVLPDAQDHAHVVSLEVDALDLPDAGAEDRHLLAREQATGLVESDGHDVVVDEEVAADPLDQRVGAERDRDDDDHPEVGERAEHVLHPPPPPPS